MYDIKIVKEILFRDLAAVIQLLYGERVVWQTTQWYVREIVGSLAGNLSIEGNNQTKLGFWTADNLTGTLSSGGILSLIAGVLRTNTGGAIDWARDFVNYPPPSPAPRRLLLLHTQGVSS